MSGLPRAEIERRVASVAHWHHAIRLPEGVVTPGVYDPRDLLARLRLGDLHGKRVLDVGARDGFFTFACERAGAEVLAVDHAPAEATGFAVASEIIGSRAEDVRANVYDLTPERFGTFDLVLFLGVLYHLRHPLLALDALRRLCRERIWVESLVCDAAVLIAPGKSAPLARLAPKLVQIPLAQFLPCGHLHADWTNKWSPNVAGLRALVADAQFAIEDVQQWGDRALVKARPVTDPSLTMRSALDGGMAPS